MPGWSTWTLWGSDPWLQGYNAPAKQSTRYYATGASITACNTDLSQRLTNLTVGTNCVYETTTTRFNYSHPRTILVRCSATSSDTGVLWFHGTGGNLERLRFSAANTIQVTVANATALTYTVSGLGGSAENLVIAWVSEANPDTTGASDAVRSWLLVYNTSDGTFDKSAQFTHVTKPLQSTTGIWGASTTGGGTAFSGTISGVLYENRAMSATEIAADWATTLTAPTTAVENDDQGLPVAATSGIGDEGEYHGPAAGWACDATRRMYRRCSSPLYNEPLRIRPTWQSTTLTGPFWRGIPGASSWRTHLSWFRSYLVPETCSHLWVRAHVRSWTTASTAVPLGVRIYSFNRRPGVAGLGQGGVVPLVPYFGQEIVTRDDDSSVGDWCIESVVPISRSSQSRTYIGVAFRIDPNSTSTNDANERFAVNAVHVVPCVLQAEGGLPFAEIP